MAKSLPEQPIWDEGVKLPQFSPLEKSGTADVVIVGGGLAGMLTAYLLTQEGKKVVLLESARIGHGATGLTTAFLSQYIDTDITELQEIFGTEKTRQILAAHAAAIDRAEDIITSEKIDCDFMRCPNYLYANTAADRRELEEERTAGEEAGVSFSWLKDSLPFTQEGCLVLPQQAKFHPLKYLAALTRLVVEGGGQIYENSEVAKLEVKNKETVVVTTAQGQEIEANYAVVATYAPFNHKLFFKKAFYSSYVLHGTVAAGRLPEGIYEDTANPYHYWRIDRGEKQDRFIFGGADHRSDIPVEPEKNYAALEEALAETWRDIPYEIQGRWRGPILETVDGLAYIGAAGPEPILYATGFSGNGMTYSHIAAVALTDHIQGRDNAWVALFAAERLPSLRALLHKGRDYSEEMLGGAVRNTFRPPSK